MSLARALVDIEPRERAGPQVVVGPTLIGHSGHCAPSGLVMGGGEYRFRYASVAASGYRAAIGGRHSVLHPVFLVLKKSLEKRKARDALHRSSLHF